MSQSYIDPIIISQYIENSNFICVLTGAGISAESGISTFRGVNGYWNRYRPDELATPEAFAIDPDLVWRWYQHRRQGVAAAVPNPGHYALAKWEALAPAFCLVTQNVDGLHCQAGSRNILELHGNIRLNRCLKCGQESSMSEITYNGCVPHCSCGGVLRPGVVWFGESLPEETLRKSIQAANDCDLFLTVGTSSLVYPAAGLPELAARRGVTVIEINPEETPLSHLATLCLRGQAGTILPQLVDQYAAACSHSTSGRKHP